MELPNTLSGLIRLAVADLEAIEQDSRYQIDMGRWHTPDVGGCNVCFAGAVMAVSLQTAMETSTAPSDYSPDQRNKLYALDTLRRADAQDIALALEEFHGHLPENGWQLILAEFEGRSLPDYHHGAGAFKRGMRDAADRLERLGY